MKQFEFKIRFITPLLIHGADSREADSIGLTGKALRGCWRFWFRAMVGGMVKDISKEDLLKLEGKIFGASDEEVGSKFRMIIEPLCMKPSTTPIQFSQRRVPFNGFKEGCEFNITIIPRRDSMSDDDISVLLSSIWLWGNLGCIGQRARRGFGSPVIYVDENNNPLKDKEIFGDCPLPIKSLFEIENPKEIENYLKEGIKIVWDTFYNWYKSQNIPKFNPPIYDHKSKPLSNPPFFIISSYGQISVADKGVGRNVIDALQKIHGSNTCSDLGAAIPARKASPVYIRLHQIDDEYFPVVTWAEPKNIGCARDYIYNNCNCKKYLDGSPV